jgi:DNA repair photolyase
MQANRNKGERVRGIELAIQEVAQLPKQRMYADRKGSLSVFVGCKFDCRYCEFTFKRQMRRQVKNCPTCAEYIPHWHPERLKNYIPPTFGEEFVWIAPNSDIAFSNPQLCEFLWQQTFSVVNKHRETQFFLQTKDPSIFPKLPHPYPANLMLGITLETNDIDCYRGVSKAPDPLQRYWVIRGNQFPTGNQIPIDVITIEPIIDFDLEIFAGMIQDINPKRVYVGYDSHHSGLMEPPLDKTLKLIEKLEDFTKVKPKLLREAIC